VINQRSNPSPTRLTAAVVRGNTALRVWIDDDIRCACIEIDGTPSPVLLGVTLSGAENLHTAITTGLVDLASRHHEGSGERTSGAPMTKNDHSNYENYREAVYAQLNQYTFALDSPDDRIVAIIARAELPRYVRYWVTLLTKHEATASGSARPVPDGGVRFPHPVALGSGCTRS
jgi:hypothetical protein